jgi:chromatin segregation and condensation protein Rec8/ScpA/Scc1 (kleisin family)
MAANLIYLKSRSLLPVDQQPPEEDVEEDDPRWDLIRQLIEYKKFKEAAAQLQVRQLEQERIFVREPNGIDPIAAAPLRLGEVGVFQLINASRLSSNASKPVKISARSSASTTPSRTRSNGSSTHIRWRAAPLLRAVRAHGFTRRDRRHVSRATRAGALASDQCDAGETVRRIQLTAAPK